MSRIYDNQPLANLPVQNVKWQGTWDSSQWTRNGQGVLVDGKILKRAKICILGDSCKVRYFLLCTNIEQAHRRQFDASGKEVEPNFGQTTKVSRGYLNSSYDVKSKGESDKLSLGEMKLIISNSVIEKIIKEVGSAPSSNDIELLVREEDLDKIDLEVGMNVRIKTAGDSPFIESLVIRDDLTSTIGNFTGDEKMGGNWTDKIMASKQSAADKPAQQASEIEDDEWDD